MAAHVDEISSIPCFLVPVNPVVAAEVIRRGGVVSLSPESGLRWEDSAEALAALKAEDRDVALTAVSRSANQIRDGLLLAQANEVEDLAAFVAELDDLAPGLLKTLLSNLDTDTVSKTWAERLAGNDDERTSSRLLLTRARAMTGQLGQLAESILQDRGDGL